ncbi:MAG: hypothetical protein K8R59_03230 [Thermoanaerobaculales bacterium]|nr:hypothetical protein [Thermoanaerobaculales bacterium]
MRTRELVATCSRGLEEVLAAEVTSLGGGKVEVGRGMVRFQGSMECMVRCCFGLRTGIRVLVPLASGVVTGRDDLYRMAREVEWEAWLRQNGTVAVEVAGQDQAFRNTRFAALVVKDGIVDRLRDRRGERPDVDLKRPDLPVHLHLRGGRASLSLDAAGEPLSHRGYRPMGGPAPLNESLAAGLLLLAGYLGERPFLDPMAGTGTLAAEAALIATRTPPGLRRKFAYQRWLDFNPALVQDIRHELGQRWRPAPCPILATDRDLKAVKSATRNLREARMDGWVKVRQGEATMMEAPGDNGLIVINPPYGRRLTEEGSLSALYQALGDRLKAVGSGCTAWILTGNRELAKHVGLQAARKIPVFNGPIECRWLRYDLYEGSRKAKGTVA